MDFDNLLRLILKLKERVDERDLRSIPTDVLKNILSFKPDPATVVEF